MTETIVNRYCDICGQNYNDCNKGRDSAEIEMTIEHQIHVMHNVFYDKDHGNISTRPVQMELCSKCFTKLMYALRNPQTILKDILPEVPKNYINEQYYDVISQEEYEKIEYGELEDKGYSSHDACSFYACPKCKYTYDGYNIPVKTYVTESGKTLVKAFTCEKCGHKMRLARL